MSVSVFAERLRNAMNSRGLKQVDLVHAAEHRGVKMGKSHISQYVAGKTMPREDVLEFLASELDVDTNWLRGEESTTQLNSDASNSVTDGEHAATPLAMGAAKPQTDSEIPVGRRRMPSRPPGAAGWSRLPILCRSCGYSTGGRSGSGGGGRAGAPR